MRCCFLIEKSTVYCFFGQHNIISITMINRYCIPLKYPLAGGEKEEEPMVVVLAVVLVDVVVNCIYESGANLSN